VIFCRHIHFGLFASFLLSLVPGLFGQQEAARPPIFRVDVDMVFVKVSVADPLNRYVTGLQKENFKVYEDSVEQTPVYFGQESAPISVGIVFDISRSMGFSNNIRIGKSWLNQFLSSSFLDGRNPQDEYSLITFNRKVNLVQAFNDKSIDLQDEVALQKPGGWTALYDAVYRGLDHIRGGKNEKKALILITDGEDNSSRYSRGDIREFTKERDIPIYAIGLPGPDDYGQSVLKYLVNITGGRAFFSSYEEIGYYFDLIHAELRSQYLLGYVPTNTLHNGKWRRIRIKLDAPPGLPKLSVRARDGYYARDY
jgi:Ca-activated chloride channel homolog